MKVERRTKIERIRILYSPTVLLADYQQRFSDAVSTACQLIPDSLSRHFLVRENNVDVDFRDVGYCVCVLYG